MWSQKDLIEEKSVYRAVLQAQVKAQRKTYNGWKDSKD